MIAPYERKSDIKPEKPTALDIETPSCGGVLKIGFAYINTRDEIEYETFDGWQGFIDHLTALTTKYKRQTTIKRRLTHIFAHNGANFDWLSLITYAQETGQIDRLRLIVNGSRAIGGRLTLTNGETIHLLDSLQLLPASLEKLCTSFDVETPKIAIPDHYKSRMEDFIRDEPELFDAYLKADVLALQEILYKFWQLLYESAGNIGYLPMTLPSLAMRMFRKQLQQPVFTPLNERIEHISRHAYHGGLVECWKPGSYDEINVYDVNSMYPAVMRDNEFPTSHRVARTDRYINGALALYYCHWRQKQRDIPPFLFNDTERSYDGENWITSAEYEYFVEKGLGDITITEGYVFQHKGRLFEDYINTWYNKRLYAQEHELDALSLVCKLLMNSLYGKFGQKRTGTAIVAENHAQIVQRIRNGEKVVPFGDFFIVEQPVEVEYAFPAVAAFVTAYARCKLMDAIIATKGTFVYADTDSVHLRGGTLETSSRLGAWKLEATGSGVYAGKKLYALRTGVKDKITAKGVGRAIKGGILTYELLEYITRTDDAVPITFTTFPSVREVLSGKRAVAVLTERTRRIRRVD